MLIAEHKLNKKHVINFTGYNLILQSKKARRNSNNTEAGTATAICIKENIKFEVINILETTNLETIAIKIFLSNGEEIAFASLYNRPQDNLLQSDMDKLLNSIDTDQIVLAGDLNARHSNWGDSEINIRGRTLKNWLEKCPRIKLIKTKYATRISRTSESFLDIFLVSPSVDIQFDVADGYNDSLKTHVFESDHNAVEMKIKKIIMYSVAL